MVVSCLTFLPRPTRPRDSAQWNAIAITPTEADEERKLHEYTTGLHERLGWKRIRDTTFISWDQGGERFLHPEELTLTDCGWPTLSLRQWYYQRDQSWPHPILAVAQTPGLSLHGGIQAWPDAAQPYFNQTRFALPLLPLWPGFAINTSFYGLLLFIAWRVPGVVCRTLRRRRGRCAACGYDRGGLHADAACPECGTRVAVASGGEPAAR